MICGVICRLWRVPVHAKRYPIAGRCNILQRDHLQMKNVLNEEDISIRVSDNWCAINDI